MRSPSPSPSLLVLWSVVLTTGCNCSHTDPPGPDANGTPPTCSGTGSLPKGCTPDMCAGNSSCQPDGRCVPLAQQVFASDFPQSDLSCTSDDPCSLDTALKTALAMHLPYLHMRHMRGRFDARIDLDGGQTLTLVADPGPAADPVTTLTSSDAMNPVIRVAGDDTRLVIYGLDIANVAPLTVVDVEIGSGHSSLELHEVTIEQNDGLAIFVSAGELTLDRTRLDGNRGGGLAVAGTAQVTVTNTLVVHNGSPTSATGGIGVNSDRNTDNLFAFVTVGNNVAEPKTSPGISCSGAQTVIANSIVFKNGGSKSTTDQVSGNCDVRSTLVYPVTPPADAGNSGTDPKLVDPDHGDYRPSTSSPAVGAADLTISLPPAAAAWDLDGTPRSCKVVGALEPMSPPPAPRPTTPTLR